MIAAKNAVRQGPPQTRRERLPPDAVAVGVLLKQDPEIHHPPPASLFGDRILPHGLWYAVSEAIIVQLNREKVTQQSSKKHDCQVQGL